MSQQVAPIGDKVHASGRSWWEVMFLGGATLAEWETIDIGLAGKRDLFSEQWPSKSKVRDILRSPLGGLQECTRWEDISHATIRAARLWMPGGLIGEVEAYRPHCVFQFKSGFRAAGLGTVVQAHVLGIVLPKESFLEGETDGACECWAYEPGNGRVQFRDNVLWFKRYEVGPLNLGAVGVRL